MSWVGSSKKVLDGKSYKFIATDDIVEMESLFWKIIYFSLRVKWNNRSRELLLELNLHVPMLVYLSNQVENNFLRAQGNVSIVWFRYIDDISFIRTCGENELERFLEKLNQLHPDLGFTYESSKKEIAILDWKVNLFKNRFIANQYLIHISTCITPPHIVKKLKRQ